MKKQIKCPNCFKRLFDLKSKVMCEIEIKCPQCKKVLEVTLSNSD